MILALAFLLLKPAEHVVLLDELVTVPASQWRAVDFSLKQRAATIECRFTVVRGESGVRLALVPRESVARFRAGESHKVILSTGYQRAGGFRYASQTGDYSLVIDNRIEGRAPAVVRLRASLLFGGTQRLPVREVPVRRRIVVIFLTILLFAFLAVFAGKRLYRATKTRGKPYGD